MKIFRNVKLLLFAILLLGTFLRLYRLGDVPAGFHRDEAFLGYNAYSILKTGRDMNGVFLPLHLRSFIYSPAGYSYSAILPIAIFGLTEFSVRLPAALFGILTIYLTYLLTNVLLHDRRIAIAAALLLTISPWHINLSRTSTENVLVVLFITLGLYLYAMWLNKKKTFDLIAAFASFGITMLLYQAPRAFLPLFIPLLLFLTKDQAKRYVRSLLVLTILFIFIPLFLIFSTPVLSLRLRTVGIPASGTVQLTTEESIREDGVGNVPPIISRLFHNKPIGFTSQFLENYFSHWSYSFLFTDKGLPDRFRVPGAPLVYLIELPLLLIGIMYLVNKKTWESKLLLGWLIVAPMGSSLAFDDVPNLQRTLIVFPALSIIAALGFRQLSTRLKPVIIIAYVVCAAMYLHAYYIHLPAHRPWFRQEGYEQLVSEIQKRKDEFSSIVVTNRETAPTIFFLFYTQYDPTQFLLETKNIPGDDRDRTSFGKYVFTTEECPVRELVENDPQILYINFGTCEDIPSTTILSTIRRGDGSAVFKLVIVDEQRKTQEGRPVSKLL